MSGGLGGAQTLAAPSLPISPLYLAVRRSAPRSAEAAACDHGDTAVAAAVLACSEQETGGADVNRGGRSSAWILATAVRSTTCSTRSRCLGMRMRSGALAAESYSEVGSKARRCWRVAHGRRSPWMAAFYIVMYSRPTGGIQ